MSEAAASAFALEPFVIDGVRVDPSALRLSSDNGETMLEPKVMALLVALSTRPGVLWQRADLLDEIWPNGFGSDEGLSRLVSLLRKALSSDHGRDDIVTTIPKLGYRLDAYVDFAVSDPNGQRAVTHNPSHSAGAAPDQSAPGGRRRFYGLIAASLMVGAVSIIWVFFANPSADPPAHQRALDQSGVSVAVLPIESADAIKARAFLAEGMTRDLTAALSQVPNARVAPYSSTRLLSGPNIDGVAAAHDLDVRYIVTGAMSVEGEQLILRMDLTDTVETRQIWSKRFTEPLAGFFELQSQVVQEISASIFSEIQASEIANVRSRDGFDLSVYELLQKAESERYAYGREPAARITAYLQRAFEIDPDNYSARAALAIQLAQNVISGFSDNPARDAPLALKYLDEARAIAPRDPRVLTSAALVQYYVKGDIGQARRLLERSLEIDPNEPHAAVVLGLIQCYSGQSEQGLSLIRNSEVRAPRDPRYGIWAWFRSACLSVEGQIAQAERAADEAIVRNPNYPPFYYALASYECLLGKHRAARNTVRLAQTLDPQFGQDDYERIISKAGFPGTPALPRDKLFRQMRACLADRPA